MSSKAPLIVDIQIIITSSATLDSLARFQAILVIYLVLRGRVVLAFYGFVAGCALEAGSMEGEHEFADQDWIVVFGQLSAAE